MSVFEDIKNRLPISEVLASYITLIPSGSQFKAKCPFHNERTASFSISPDKGFYYCFGCGAKGDIFTFVEQFEGLDKKGALKVLADRAGVVLTKSSTVRESTDPLYELLDATATRYQGILAEHKEATEYLSKRGVTADTIAEFRIGYAPDEWRTVAGTLAGTAEVAIGERAGLIKKIEDGRMYDRFRRRIMFPLSDPSGRIVGFSGRLFPQVEDDSAKYLNSPETELFQKSRILFGFDKAKAHIRKHNFAILVEGQFDLVLSHQAGFRNTVATSGTAVSDTMVLDPMTNLAAIARLTPNIILAFDGDAAGQKALARAALVALRLGMNPKVAHLPEGLDPADYVVAHGAEKWKEVLKESKHFILHEIDTLLVEHPSPHALVALVKARLFPYISAMPSPLEQNLYLETIARSCNTSKQTVVDEFALFLKSHPDPVATSEERPMAPLEGITLFERINALADLLPQDESSARDELKQLSFKDEVFTLPSISPERESFVSALVQQEYSSLDDGEKQAIVGELAAKIREQFFASLRTKYSLLLARAEEKNDEQVIATTLAILQELNQLKHNTTGTSQPTG